MGTIISPHPVNRLHPETVPFVHLLIGWPRIQSTLFYRIDKWGIQIQRICDAHLRNVRVFPSDNLMNFSSCQFTSSFSAPSLGFNISGPGLHVRFPTVIQTTPVKYFYFTCTVFSAKAVQTGLLLLNNSTPSIPAAYPPIVLKYTVAFMISIVWSWISRISSGSHLGKRVRTASILGIFPCMQFFQSFSHTFRRRKNWWLSYHHQKQS